MPTRYLTRLARNVRPDDVIIWRDGDTTAIQSVERARSQIDGATLIKITPVPDLTGPFAGQTFPLYYRTADTLTIRRTYP